MHSSKSLIRQYLLLVALDIAISEVWASAHARIPGVSIHEIHVVRRVARACSRELGAHIRWAQCDRMPLGPLLLAANRRYLYERTV